MDGKETQRTIHGPGSWKGRKKVDLGKAQEKLQICHF